MVIVARAELGRKLCSHLTWRILRLPLSFSFLAVFAEHSSCSFVINFSSSFLLEVVLFYVRK